MFEEIIGFLRDKTHLARLSIGEVRDVMERLETEGYAIVKKAEAAVEPVAPLVPVPVAPVEPVAVVEPVAPVEPVSAPVEPPAA